MSQQENCGQLKLTDYDKDYIRVDCPIQNRVYVDSGIKNAGVLDEGCVSLDKRAARAIINILTRWLGDDLDAYTVEPTVIEHEE